MSDEPINMPASPDYDIGIPISGDEFSNIDGLLDLSTPEPVKSEPVEAAPDSSEQIKRNAEARQTLAAYVDAASFTFQSGVTLPLQYSLGRLIMLNRLSKQDGRDKEEDDGGVTIADAVDFLFLATHEMKYFTEWRDGLPPLKTDLPRLAEEITEWSDANLFAEDLPRVVETVNLLTAANWSARVEIDAPEAQKKTESQVH